MHTASFLLGYVVFVTPTIMKAFFDKTDITIKNCLLVAAYFTLIGISAVESAADPNDLSAHIMTIAGPPLAGLAGLWLAHSENRQNTEK